MSVSTLRGVRGALAADSSRHEPAKLGQALLANAPGQAGWRRLADLAADLRAELYGAGAALQPLVDDDRVTDVLINSYRGVWIDRGGGLHRTDIDVGAETEVRAMAVRLAAACGQRLDDASPIVDGSLPDGTRLHAVLPPLADGTHISLRTQQRRALTLEELTASGTVAEQVAPVLATLVGARSNVLISGAAGVGKTTLLAALLSTVPATERIVCIEEAIELRPAHPHVVHLQVRHANVQRVGGVTMAELVRAAMRMRPDRLVLGECRGPEVREALSALNTGHDGGWATVHANACADVPARLVALGALADLPESTVATQAASALDAVIHLSREGPIRRVEEIALLVRDSEGLACETALHLPTPDTMVLGPAWPRLARRLDGVLLSGAS